MDLLPTIVRGELFEVKILARWGLNQKKNPGHYSGVSKTNTLKLTTL
jgi:hypothetical protein